LDHSWFKGSDLNQFEDALKHIKENPAGCLCTLRHPSIFRKPTASSSLLKDIALNHFAMHNADIFKLQIASTARIVRYSSSFTLALRVMKKNHGNYSRRSQKWSDRHGACGKN